MITACIACLLLPAAGIIFLGMGEYLLTARPAMMTSQPRQDIQAPDNPIQMYSRLP